MAADEHPKPYRPVSGSYINQAPEPSRERVPGEVDLTHPGGVQTLRRSYLTKASSISEPRPLPLPAVAKQVTAVAVTRNNSRPVKFAVPESEESEDEEDVPVPAPAHPRPPSPPIVKKEPKAAQPAQKKSGKR